MSAVSAHDATVLVIDDEESLRDACSQVLTREGFTVITAEGGEKGLELAQRHRPEVVILDLAMPRMGGMEVLDELGRAVPDSIRVVITAYATVSSALEAIRHGAYDFLPKPFTPEELRVITSRALERWALEHRARELAAQRDKAKHRFLELVTREVRGPVTGALAKLHQIETMLAGDNPDHRHARELAREAGISLSRLMSLVERWQAGNSTTGGAPADPDRAQEA